MNFLIKTTLLAGALLLAAAAAHAETRISEVTVLTDTNQLRIEGQDFGPAPTIHIGNYAAPLGVVVESIPSNPCASSPPEGPTAAECVIADLPVGIVDGDYLLWLTRDPATGSCANGKPTALTFAFNPNACDATTNFQEGKAECSGPGPNDVDDVTIELTKDANKTDVIVSPSGDEVTFRAREIGTRLKSSLKFNINQGGSTVQSLIIHSSCSKPLDVGDTFGSMTLVALAPATVGKGKNNDENSAHYDLTIGAAGTGVPGPEGPQGPKGDPGGGIAEGECPSIPGFALVGFNSAGLICRCIVPALCE
jgi:hypothetical protein